MSINSIYDESTVSEKTPYGKGVNDALNYMAALGKLYGFDVDMCDGRGVELSYGDKGPLISIFAHLDVVPVSNDWKHPPFALSYDDKEKMLYGRGVADDNFGDASVPVCSPDDVTVFKGRSGYYACLRLV